MANRIAEDSVTSLIGGRHGHSWILVANELQARVFEIDTDTHRLRSVKVFKRLAKNHDPREFAGVITDYLMGQLDRKVFESLIVVVDDNIIDDLQDIFPAVLNDTVVNWIPREIRDATASEIPGTLRVEGTVMAPAEFAGR